MPNPFVSRQDLSDYLGRDVTTDPAALAAVDAACEVCRDISEQTFDLVTGDTIKLDGTGTDCLLLPELPVASAGTVIVNGGTLTATEYALGRNGELFRTNGDTGWSTRWSGSGSPWLVWPEGRQNIKVTYDHGAGTVPSSVRMVAQSLAERLLVQGAAVFESIGPNQVRYAGPPMDLTNGELRILRKYRQTR